MSQFGDPGYWESRYEKAGTFSSYDWLSSYGSLRSAIDPYLVSSEVKILILGCGNAKFSEDLYDAGYHNIVNVDLSATCIN